MPSTSREKKKRNALPFQLRVRLDAASTSTSPTPSRRSKTQQWRDNLAARDPVKRAEEKEQEKLYSRYYRAQCATAQFTLENRNLSTKEKAEAEKWLERKKRNNETARIRMQKMNDRKKAEAGKKNKTKKAQTRQQHEKSKKKESEKKRKQRAAYTKERRDEVLARRRELYAMKTQQTKIMVLQEKEERLREREQNIMEQEKQVQDKESDIVNRNEELQRRNNILPNDNTLDLRSSTAKKQALYRLRKALPIAKSHCINTSLDLINNASPTKVRAFREAGVHAQSQLAESVMDAVAVTLQAPKKSASRKSLASALSAVKKQRLQRKFCRTVGVSRKLLQKAKKIVAGRKPVSLETVDAIHAFFETNSNQLPDKKLVSKKTMKPRHVMDVTIAKLYQQFAKEHPDMKVCKSVFYKHRPRHVKYKAQAKYVGCLCEYCENVELKIKAINKVYPGALKDMYHVTSLTMCAKQEGSAYNKPSCIRRQCGECGVQNIQLALTHLDDAREVKWKRWDMVESVCYSKKQAKSVKKRSLVEKTGAFRDIIAQLKEEMIPHAEHIFNKDWQHKEESELRRKLNDDEVLGIFDFAENFKCSYQREVQSAYYSHDSATVHPIVTYYNCKVCLKAVTESCVMISNDLTHDYHLVHTFQKVVTKHLTETRGLTLSKFYRFSDGCSSQYKSKGPISDISYAYEDYGLNINHNYSGTRHGKGPSDGESGVVKRHASDAIKAGSAIINNPKALFDYLSKVLVKDAEDGNCCISFRRTIHFVPFEDVNRDRPGRALKTVEGTRKIHSVVNVSGGIVAIRNLSCFCDGCLRGIGDCKNSAYVNQWNEINLQKSKQDKKRKTRKASSSTSLDDKAHDPAPGLDDVNDELDTVNEDARSADTFTNQDDDDDASSTVNTEIPQPEKIKVNGFVAVKFAGVGKNGKAIVYMAMVMGAQEDSLQLKFMRRNELGFYDFTLERQATHPMSDIIKPMTEPAIVQVGRRSYLYKFADKDLINMYNKFELK